MSELSLLNSATVINLLEKTVCNNYVLAIVNSNGEIREIVSESKHVSQLFISILKSKPLNYFYDIPKCESLNELFSATFDESVLQNTGNFKSKNIAESSSEVANFVSALHLSNISFFRINRAKFIALISLNEHYQQLSRISDKRIVITDTEGEILAYSLSFADLFSIAESNLLHKKLSSAISIDKMNEETKPSDIKWIEETNIRSRESWLECCNQILSPSSICEIKDSQISIINKSATEYSYIELKTKLNTDTNDYLIEWSGLLTDGSIANIITRGIPSLNTPMIHINPPDYFGFNVSITERMNKKYLLLKKSGTPVAISNSIQIKDNDPYTISFLKSGHHYELSINQRKSLEWNDYYPFNDGNFDHIYFFVRPCSSLSLSELTIKSFPTGKLFKAASPPATAKINTGSEVRFFQITSHSVLWSDSMLVYHGLEEITELKENIFSLEREKKRLSLLARDNKRIVGKSQLITEISRQIEKVAKTNLSILIEGETGTGKEVIAHNIHLSSNRSEAPFIKIDCSAIPESLFESEVFGHEKGAFTGATSTRPGRFEQAQNGMVFLDEIANIPINIQAKLLSVIQDKKIHRIGGLKPIELDIRFIFATNIPLADLIKSGRIREDLSYRINQYKFNLPPLRERKEDITPLSEHFLEEARSIYKKPQLKFSDDAVQILCSHNWPGNIRELRNEILRAALLCEGETIDEKLLDCYKTRRKKRTRITKEIFIAAVQKEKGNIKQLANTLSVGRPLVYRLFERYGLSLSDIRKTAKQLL